MCGAADLCVVEGAVAVLRHVGFEPPSVLRVVVGDEPDAASYDVGVLLHEASADTLDGVGLVELLLDGPHHVVGGHFDGGQHFLDFEVLHLQLRLRAVLHFFVYAFAGEPVLHDRRGLDEHGGDDDDGEAGPVLECLELLRVLQFHVFDLAGGLFL